MVAGFDGTNVQHITVDASGNIQVDIVAEIPAGTQNIGDVDVLTLPGTAAEGGALPAVFVVVAGDDGVDTHPLQLDASGFLKAILQANTGVDIGDVDVLSLPNLLETLVDDAVFTPATSRVFPMGAEADETTPDSVDEGDIGALRMSLRRELYTQIRDAAGGERGANVDVSNNLTVVVNAALPAGTNNIGDVDVLSVVPGTAATNLGKAEDAAHSTGDVGVLLLGVRNDVPTALTSTDLDYSPVAVDSMGHVQVDVLTGGGADAPTSAVVDDQTSASLAPGASIDLEFALITNATTGKLQKVDLYATVPYKAIIKSRDNVTLVTLAVVGGRAGETVQYEVPHRDYFSLAGDGVDNNFRVTFTNLEPTGGKSADVYGTAYWDEQ